MKKITFALLAFVLFTSLLNAQCFREGSLTAIDDPAQYPVTGTATMNFETSGTKEVVFGNDFATVQGIELRVFLSTTLRLGQGGNEMEISTEPLQDDNGGMDMGDPITGMKVFDLPSGVNLSDFEYVIIQCVQADVLWGRATLGDNQGADCNILGIEEAIFDNLSIFPNPTTNTVTIGGINDPITAVQVFDLNGRKVIDQIGNISNTIDVSNLTSGLYVITVRANDQEIRRRIVVQ
ncbi:MAG: T9SS type A sorting domain-containing protein [Bacteroidota bacterium]